MKTRLSSQLLGVIGFYKYLFSFLTAICLFVLPLTTPYSQVVVPQRLDIVFRCITWIFFVFCYWSVATALTSQIAGTGRFFWSMKKGWFSLMVFALNAIMLGSAVGLATYWALLAFLPWLVGKIISVLAILNGLIYGLLAFLRYFWLRDNM